MALHDRVSTPEFFPVVKTRLPSAQLVQRENAVTTAGSTAKVTPRFPVEFLLPGLEGCSRDCVVAVLPWCELQFAGTLIALALGAGWRISREMRDTDFARFECKPLLIREKFCAKGFECYRSIC